MEFACVEGPVPSCPGDHCRGLAWMFRGGPGGLGGDHRAEGPSTESVKLGVLNSVSLAKAVSGPDCAVESIVTVNMSAFHLG